MTTNPPPPGGQRDRTFNRAPPRNGSRTVPPRVIRPGHYRRAVVLLAAAGLLLAVTGPATASAPAPAHNASLKSLTQQLVADGAVGAIGAARHGEDLTGLHPSPPSRGWWRGE